MGRMAESTAPVRTPERFPQTLKPMLASLGAEPFSDPKWVFEPKLDRFRILAFIREGEVTLLTRNGNDYTRHYPWVAQDLAAYSDSEMVVDGEMAALNDKGVPDFNLMQHSAEIALRGLKLGGEYPIVYYPFDLLHLDGGSLLNAPLHERKAILKNSLTPTDRIQLVDHVEADGESFFKASVELGLEGMVAKRRDSIYQPGVRTKDWLKIKRFYQQDFVVGGYTTGSGSRASTLGSLLVGCHEGKVLLYAGRVGSGFSMEMLEALMEPLELLGTDRCPFSHDRELSRADAKWVSPKIVVHVRQRRCPRLSTRSGPGPYRQTRSLRAPLCAFLVL